jgi:hypothetical protein
MHQDDFQRHIQQAQTTYDHLVKEAAECQLHLRQHPLAKFEFIESYKQSLDVLHAKIDRTVPNAKMDDAVLLTTKRRHATELINMADILFKAMCDTNEKLNGPFEPLPSLLSEMAISNHDSIKELFEKAVTQFHHEAIQWLDQFKFYLEDFPASLKQLEEKRAALIKEVEPKLSHVTSEVELLKQRIVLLEQQMKALQPEHAPAKLGNTLFHA